MYLHISFTATEDCINLNSYGAICVRCNACGRFDKDKQKESALKMWQQKLQEEYEFDGWVAGFEDIQKENIAANIEYIKGKIAEFENDRRRI